MDKDICLHIFERYISGEVSDDEVLRLRSYLKNDAALNRWIESRIADAPETIDPDVKTRMLNNIRSQTGYAIAPYVAAGKKNNNIRLYLRRISNIAAVLLPVVIILGIWFYPKPGKAELFEIVAGKGEKSNLTLSEGSKVVINSDSKIGYYSDYNQKNRYMKLTGEAYFEVNHDPEKPFVVECGDVKVKVLGSVFGIKTYENEENISVVLNSGKIQFITPKEQIDVAPDDLIIYNKTTQKITRERVDADDYTDWRKNRLRFENESLETIMKTISRMHNIDIVFEDSQLKTRLFTGTIDNTSIKNVLDAIKLTSLINYRAEGGIVYLYTDK
jgi:ferric-dicitrate binding protein FerR (iron transport regulator)